MCETGIKNIFAPHSVAECEAKIIFGWQGYTSHHTQ